MTLDLVGESSLVGEEAVVLELGQGPANPSCCPRDHT